MTKTVFDTSSICGYDADTIMVRNRDLVKDLIGKVSFTEMIVLQLTGNMPTPAQTAILDAVLVTIMEHGMVPSAIVTRLTHYGAPESLQGAVAAGLLGVGDRFAGTASACGKLLDSLVNTPEAQRKAAAVTLVRDCRERKAPLPGFGHSIHKQGDPRVARLLAIAEASGCKGEHIRALHLLETVIAQELGKPLITNVSAAIAAVLAEAAIPADAMRGLVLIARCAGLTGHLYEEGTRPVAETLWHAAEQAVRYDPDS